MEEGPLGRSSRAYSKREGGSTWEGNATDLLEDLNGVASLEATRHWSWPRNARALSGQLTRVARALRAQGITVDRDREGKQRTIRITYDAPLRPATPSAPPRSPRQVPAGFDDDDEDEFDASRF